MIDKQSLLETLTLLLPSQAELEVFPDKEDFYAAFCWLLNNDPARPYKRSKRVHFVVSTRALTDFQNVGNKQEARVQKNIETYINHKLSKFNPDHEAEEGQPEPIEKWKIDSLLFLEELEKVRGINRPIF